MTSEGSDPLAVYERALNRPEAPISDASRTEIAEVHIADSLAALEFDQLLSAVRVADIGSGAGLPGLPLAASLPEQSWDLVEATAKKCRFLESSVAAMGLRNVSVRPVRTEDLSLDPAGREAFDVVTARAVGSLATTAELASPLLRKGGHLLIWRGARDLDEEHDFEAIASSSLALETLEVRAVSPYPESRDRHIHLFRKNGATPEGLPRRTGVAAKRPFGPE